MSDGAARPAKLFIPGLSGIYGRLSPLGYAVMRASLGLILFPHGVNKLFFNDARVPAVNVNGDRRGPRVDALAALEDLGDVGPGEHGAVAITGHPGHGLGGGTRDPSG